MGMYTLIEFSLKLDETHERYDDVRRTLEIMLTGNIFNNISKLWPDVELFRAARWDYMLCCDSAYHDEDTMHRAAWPYLYCVSNFKNYDEEVEKFVAWIEPYVSGMSLRHRYEEATASNYHRVGTAVAPDHLADLRTWMGLLTKDQELIEAAVVAEEAKMPDLVVQALREAETVR